MKTGSYPLIRRARILELTISMMDMSAASTPSALSPRLQQTLDALMTGASEKQIASQLGISPHTTHQYVKMLFRRFRVTSRPELMALILRR